MHPEDVPRILEHWGQTMARKESFEGEMRLRRADGEYRWFIVRTAPLLDEQGKVLRWYGTSTDIEDRKRAEQALREAADRLQHLSRRLLEVQEAERRHLARELHDEFGQLLATINLHLHAARGVVRAEARQHLEEATFLLQRAGGQVRSLALELRPTMLESAGVDATLRWLAEQHKSRTGTSTEVVGRLDDVPGDLAVCCFRVAQEALTNVVQHAGAKHVSIELSRGDEALELVVRDDGVGFDAATKLEQATQRGRLGLLGMKERVQILGGSLKVDSAAGRGTEIRVSLPLAKPLIQSAESAA
jgi:two-component system sensor histidine kinase UhpB